MQLLLSNAERDARVQHLPLLFRRHVGDQGRLAATVRLTEQDLISVNNALKEVCNGIDVPEFSTRMGADHREVLEILRQINALIADVEKRTGDAAKNAPPELAVLS